MNGRTALSKFDILLVTLAIALGVSFLSIRQDTKKEFDLQRRVKTGCPPTADNPWLKARNGGVELH
jgi:hypothetical protein